MVEERETFYCIFLFLCCQEAVPLEIVEFLLKVIYFEDDGILGEKNAFLVVFLVIEYASNSSFLDLFYLLVVRFGISEVGLS